MVTCHAVNARRTSSTLGCAGRPSSDQGDRRAEQVAEVADPEVRGDLLRGPQGQRSLAVLNELDRRRGQPGKSGEAFPRQPGGTA
jgi:hypothetical protein